MEKLATIIYRLVHFFEDRGNRKLARFIRRFADFVDLIGYRGIKYTLLHIVWEMLMSLDKGESFEGESAPFCGFHYCGFENKYLSTYYNEGDGGGATKFSVLGYRLAYENVEQDRYYLTKA